MIEPEALAFDLFGTLVDPVGIAVVLERHLGDQAQRVSELWRQKQLEYTWRLTAMGWYEDFEWVTRRSLGHALAVTGAGLSAGEVEEVMAAYDRLGRFADVEEGLSRLQEAGHRMVVFSNGNPRLLEAVIASASLRPPLEGWISVDEIRVYKPAAATYRHCAASLGRPPGEVRLISSNPFDIIGAQRAGLRVAWLDRTGGVFDALGEPPLRAASLSELAGVLDAAGR